MSPHAPPLRGSLPPEGADPAWGGPAPDRVAPLPGVHELAEGEVRGFDPSGAGQDTLFVLRHAGRLHAWANACPHLGVPMAWRRDAYLNASGTHVQCHAHGALFDKTSGLCVQGPCLGQHLKRIPLVTDEAGRVHAVPDQDSNSIDTSNPTLFKKVET